MHWEFSGYFALLSGIFCCSRAIASILNTPALPTVFGLIFEMLSSERFQFFFGFSINYTLCSGLQFEAYYDLVFKAVALWVSHHILPFAIRDYFNFSTRPRLESSSIFTNMFIVMFNLKSESSNFDLWVYNRFGETFWWGGGSQHWVINYQRAASFKIRRI